jgi:hypothetical protein
MHFKRVIDNILKENDIVLFIDMDGVLASYDFGKPYNFDMKRPLNSNINKIKEILNDKIEVHILSVCNNDSQIEEKNDWLDKYVNYAIKDNRHIISKESNPFKTSAQLKLEFLESFSTNKKVVLIDDDNVVLKVVHKGLKDAIMIQDSELID